jgi:hypothetical protein
VRIKCESPEGKCGERTCDGMGNASDRDSVRWRRRERQDAATGIHRTSSKSMKREMRSGRERTSRNDPLHDKQEARPKYLPYS